MKSIRRILTFITFFLITCDVFAQVSSGGVPVSLIDRTLLGNKSSLNTYQLPYINNELARQYADSISEITQQNYYGKGLDIGIDIKQQGQLIEYNNTNNGFNDSGKVWLLFIESPTAYGIQFYFNEYKLPDGASLYIYNEDKTMLLGSFTSFNNPENEELDIKFGTQPIRGNSIIIEYFEPNDAEFEGELSIINIIHVFDNLFEKSGPNGLSAPCMIDVNCPEGFGWGNEKKSVALILYYNSQDRLAALCSGALINNTEDDGRPLFLSANHCTTGVGAAYNYSTWVFLFNHEMLNCDGSIYNYGNSTYGSTLLANGTISDYLLLELNTSSGILASYGACFAGWTLTEDPQGSFVGIHHPSGDVKKISGANNIIDYSNNYWHIDWDFGSTQNGSSGSPLFENNHRIIGQIHYGIGGNVCHHDKITGYGKFTTSWDDGNFSFWLDPHNTGQVSTNTYCPVNHVGGESELGGSHSHHSCKTYEYEEAAFSVNGRDERIIEVCAGENIILKATIEDDLGFKPMIKWKRATGKNRCDKIKDEQPFEYNEWTNILGITICEARFALLFISITLCDENLNPISTEFNKWVSMQISDLSLPIGYVYSECMFFNLLDYLPSQYLSFQSNQFYKIKVATSVYYNKWCECTKYIHFFSESRNVDSINDLNYNVYGKNVTISNSIITDPIEVVASSSIKLSEGTNIKAGHCYIDEEIGCFSFVNKKLLLSNNSNNDNKFYYSQVDYLSREDKYFDEKYGIENYINVHPNPFKNSFNIELNQEQKSVVNIYLTNNLGRKVLQFYSGELEKGEHLFEVKDISLPPGFYLCVYETPTLKEVNKIIKIE